MDKKSKDALKIKLSGILPELNERQRRIVLAAEAASLGYGGIRVLSDISGVAESTIRRGVGDLRKKPRDLVAARSINLFEKRQLSDYIFLFGFDCIVPFTMEIVFGNINVRHFLL